MSKDPSNHPADDHSYPDWMTQLTETIPVDVADQRIQSYQPQGPDPKPGSDYFRQPRYPYPNRLDVRDYLKTNYLLQIELVKLQNWVQTQEVPVLIIFEGRDTAGKGSTIKTLTQNLNPRAVSVVALGKPTKQELGQWYFQRYTNHLPDAGRIALFDRSWYNRAGVERVMNFCSEPEYWRFVEQAPQFETMLVDTGIRLIKFYLSISKEEQALRILERETNPLKQWKLSKIDQEAQTKWDDYTQAKEDTLRLTATDKAPWTIVKADDRLRARLSIMRFVLSHFDYTGKNSEVVGTPDPLLVADAARIYSPTRLNSAAP